MALNPDPNALLPAHYTLKPCAHCGSPAYLIKCDVSFKAKCTNGDCQVQSPATFSSKMTSEIWNQRAEREVTGSQGAPVNAASMPPQPKHDRSPMEDALYQARTMAAFFLAAYCPDGEELEDPDARSIASYEYHQQRLIEAIERYAASMPLAEALGSDQQGNRASQEPPVAGVRAAAPVSAEMQSAVDAVLGKPDPYTLR